MRKKMEYSWQREEGEGEEGREKERRRGKDTCTN